MDYVTDTHPIVWYFTDDPRLSRHALEVFEKTIREEVIIIPIIVLAEIMYISNKGNNHSNIR
jgi:predicted nucleic acid-binding protein